MSLYIGFIVLGLDLKMAYIPTAIVLVAVFVSATSGTSLKNGGIRKSGKHIIIIIGTCKYNVMCLYTSLW